MSHSSFPTRFGYSCLSSVALCAAFALSTGFGQEKQDKKTQGREAIGFDQVQPILRKRCQNCHNSEELRGDLSATDMAALAAGSSSGPVVVSGKPRESLLYTTAAHLDEPTMPPNSRKIPGRELELIRRWIEDGLLKKSGDQPAVPEMPSGPNVDDTEKLSEAAKTFESLKSLLQPTALTSIATDSGGRFVALPGDRQVALLDLQTHSLTRAIPIPEPDITQLVFANAGQRLLVGGGTAGLSGSIWGFDIQSGKQLFKLADESDSILALDVSPDDQLVAFGGPSKLLKVCRVADGSLVHTMRKHTDWVMCAKFSHDGLLLASADRFGGLFVWEAASGELFHALDGHVGPVHSLAWDSDGETLLSAGEDGQIRVWNMHHGELTAQWDGGVGPILSIDRATSATLVGGRDGLVKAWGTPEYCAATYNAKDQVDHVLFAGQSTCIVADASGGIHCLSTPELAPIKHISFPIHPDARTALLVRLEHKSAEFDAELKERQQQELAIKQQLATERTSSEESDRTADLARVTALRPVAPATSSEMASLVQALRTEIDLAEQALANQTNERQRVELRLARLQTEMESKSSAVDATKSQIDRLQRMLQLATQASAKAPSAGPGSR